VPGRLQDPAPVDDAAHVNAQLQGVKKPVKSPELTAAEREFRRRSWWWLAGAGGVVAGYFLLSGRYDVRGLVDMVQQVVAADDDEDDEDADVLGHGDDDDDERDDMGDDHED
jgi:hypothetical protein